MNGRMVALAQFHLRLPVELYRELQRCAVENNRSFNAEIVWRLRQSVEGYR